MNPFRSVTGVWMSRNVLRLMNQEQWRRAKESRRPEDFEEAKHGSDSIGLLELLQNVMRLMR